MTTFLVPVKTPNPLNGSHRHWLVDARRRKRQHRAAFYVCPRYDLPALVHMTRLSAGTLDDDNLRAALKAVRDGIAARMNVDDADPRVRFEYSQRKVKPGEFGVEVTISRLPHARAIDGQPSDG